MKATYTIEWPDNYGPAWMNIDNLKLCLFSATYMSGEASDKVTVEEQWTETPRPINTKDTEGE